MQPSLRGQWVFFLASCGVVCSFCSAAPWGRWLALCPCPCLSWCSLPCLPELNDSPQVRKYKSMILEDLESALAEHAPAPQEVNSELPPLTIDGIPVSVDKMTQVSSQTRQNQRERKRFGVLQSHAVFLQWSFCLHLQGKRLIFSFPWGCNSSDSS